MGFKSWNPLEHSDDDNLRWALLRAMEWINWPLFISQPLVPVLLYFAPWQWVIGVVILLTFAWRLLVVPAVVSPTLAFIGPMFVMLRFATCPVMAFLLWQKGELWIAALALLWPVVGVFIAQGILTVLWTPFSVTGLGRATEVGTVQRRFMRTLGYERRGDHAP